MDSKSKKTIYLEFKLDENCSRKQKFFNEIENGIVFNLFCDKNGSFLYKGISDTISISKLKNYHLLHIEEVEKLEYKWRANNKIKLKKKFGKIYPRFNKNGIFNTYLLEIINENKFVLYTVEWRGENIDCNLDEIPPAKKKQMI
ncbi:MAG: hypothetical protein ACK4M4_04355 [Flavobacterium sp.]